MVGEGSIVVLESDGVIALDISIDREIEVPVTCEVVTQPRTAKGGFVSGGPCPAWWMYVCIYIVYIYIYSGKRLICHRLLCQTAYYAAIFLNEFISM